MEDVLVCAPQPASARQARTYVVDRLQEWGLDRLVDSAALMTSELATNAILHTRQPFQVRVTRRDASVRVEVEDSSPILPQVRETTPAGEIDLDRIGDMTVDLAPNDLFSGLGMVDAVATAWGSERLGDNGKVVWFELSTSASFEDDADRARLREPQPDEDDDLAAVLAPTGLHDLDDARRHLGTNILVAVAALVAVVAAVYAGLWAGGIIGAVWYGH